MYFYATAQTTHTTYADGVELFQFPNEQVRCAARLPIFVTAHVLTSLPHAQTPDLSRTQVEKHFPNSKKKEIRFRDGTVKLIDEMGNETTIFADGTEERKMASGVTA